MLFRRTQHVTVEDNWFHDCYGCDFIHRRFGSHLTIRRNRFERALPCRFRLLGRVRCVPGPRPAVQGQWLRVERNHFGVYKYGGAQLSPGADRPRLDRQQRVRRDRPPRSGLSGADEAHHRRKGRIACRASSKSSTTRS